MYDLDLKSKLPSVPKSVKLLAYCPGYQIAYITEPPLDQPWTPGFKPADMTHLEGTLTDTKGKPLPNQRLRLSYHMIEAMSFFGYFDGMVPKITISSIETGKDGTFQAEIPVLERDPFFQKHGTSARPSREFAWSLESSERPTEEPRMLRPSSLPVQTRYDIPYKIQVVQKARLQGRIEQGFLKKNDIAGEVRGGPWPEEERGYRLDLEAESKDGMRHYNCFLTPDLTFSVLLAPEEYDIRLYAMKRGYLVHKKVLAKEGIVLKEGEDLDVLVE
ncbi:MAG: hypothetical protein ABSE73_26790 [Planctomycetota bacterium]